MSLRIRAFEKRDQEVVRDLILEGLAERWGSEFDSSYNQDLADIHNYYIGRHDATVVVLELDPTSTLTKTVIDTASERQDDNEIIGCGILLPLPAEDVYGAWCAEPPAWSLSENLKMCRMMRLAVLRSHRGKGLAKRIIKHLMDRARAQGFDKILVETQTAWTSAVQIYSASGFRVVEAGDENIHYEYDLHGYGSESA